MRRRFHFRHVEPHRENVCLPKICYIRLRWTYPGACDRELHYQSWQLAMGRMDHPYSFWRCSIPDRNFPIGNIPSLLLKWKAEHLRRETGNKRFSAELEIIHKPLGTRLATALTRPVTLALEPIVISMTLYLTVLYIILFTFLDGYTYIFENVYGISQSLTNVIFVGIFVGVLLAGFLVPWLYNVTKTSSAKGEFVPEERLWFAMLGAPAIPISLFWMGWTSNVSRHASSSNQPRLLLTVLQASISIWSPITASVLLGYGLICIFMTAYMYIIDSYEVYAASALTFVTFTRYLIAGVMTVVGVPLCKNVSHHWVLTILGCVSILMTPIPYVFYRYGYLVRRRNKYAVPWKQ
jgi:hypothetical protein